MRHRIDVRPKTNVKSTEKLISKPNYERMTIFDENLVAIHIKKAKLVFNKPVYLRMSVLGLSKTLMYYFHYNYMKQKHSENCKLLMTDKHSLMYQIETEGFYDDIKDDIPKWFDTSNYQEAFDIKRMNKKVAEMFKDECEGKIIEAFCGLRAKLCSYKMCSDSGEGIEEKRCKGVKKNVSKPIHFDDCRLNGVCSRECKNCVK